MKKSQKKLTLSRETLRLLRGEELPRMVGGNLTNPQCDPYQKDYTSRCQYTGDTGPVPTGPFVFGCPSYGNQCTAVNCP